MKETRFCMNGSRAMPNKTRSIDKPTGDDANRDLAQRARNAAGALGHAEGAELLRQILDEEKAADEKLSGLAADGINQSAADASQPEDDSDDEDSDEDDSEEEDDDEDDEGDSEEEEEYADARPGGSGTKKATGAKSKWLVGTPDVRTALGNS